MGREESHEHSNRSLSRRAPDRAPPSSQSLSTQDANRNGYGLRPLISGGDLSEESESPVPQETTPTNFPKAKWTILNLLCRRTTISYAYIYNDLAQMEQVGSTGAVQWFRSSIQPRRRVRFR